MSTSCLTHRAGWWAVAMSRSPSERGPGMGMRNTAAWRSTSSKPLRRSSSLAQDIERVPFLEVRDRQSRKLIAVLELLSPSNKRGGPDREQYMAKRNRLLASEAHFVEIDLLRGGRPMPPEDRPDCDYSVLVSRAEIRPRAGFWPIGLRQRLPIIPIPLRRPDGIRPDRPPGNPPSRLRRDRLRGFPLRGSAPPFAFA